MRKFSILILLIAALVGCDEFENSAEKSKITYLPLIEINGGSDIELDCTETSFTDPGAVASEGGEPIALETQATGLYFGGHWEDGTGNWENAHWVYDEVDFTNPDSYQIAYSAVNVDGIPGAATRNVYWPVCNGDMVTSIEGMYKMSVRRNGSNMSGGAVIPVDDNGPFFIRHLGGNVYALSDGMGGWYEHGRGFGPYDGPALGMTVTANNIATNDFTYGPTFSISVFGGAVNTTAFTVNAATKTINFTTKWDSDYDNTPDFTFDVTLVQCPEGVACWD